MVCNTSYQITIMHWHWVHPYPQTLSQARRRWRSSSSSSSSTEQIVLMASCHLHNMSPSDIASYWNLVLQSMKRSKRKQDEKLIRQLNSIFSRMVKVIIVRQDEFNSTEIATFLRTAMSSISPTDDDDGYDGSASSRLLLSSMKASVMNKCFNQCNARDLSNTAWGYAVANINTTQHVFSTSHCEEESTSAFIKACMRLQHKFTVAGLSQLHQWQLWQYELQSNVNLPPSLKLRCYQAFIERLPRPSALQNSVVYELKAMGFQPQVEVLTKSGYLIDATITIQPLQQSRKERIIAIEVDGPYHFVGKQPTIRTLLKRRQVAKLEGMTVVSVPFWEWNKRRKDRCLRQQYLRSLLGLFLRRK